MDFEPFLRLTIAALLSIPIGLDRELRGKPAGLRTHVVVSVAAAGLGYVSVLSAPLSATGEDGTRIAAQVVSGIGFMGAGVIFASQGRVHGLTTAAALFSAAAVGLCAGLGQPALALALALVTMLFLWPVEAATGRLIERLALEERVLHVITPELENVVRVQRVIADGDATVRDVELDQLDNRVLVRLVMRGRRAALDRVLGEVRRIDRVTVIADRPLEHSD